MSSQHPPRAAFLFALLLISLPALADPSRPGGSEEIGDADWAFKLTPSWYSTTHQAAATDVNVRATNGAHAFWLGHYRQGGSADGDNGFEQTRTGYEYTLVGAAGKLVPSLQVASHGFVGGSVNAEIGTQVFALLGFGRTNTRAYYNLNFDPNDSVVYGFGTRLVPASTISLYAVRDDRLDTGQVVTHAVWRYQVSDLQRLTVDVSNKHGRPSPDEASVAGRGVSLTYDYASVFVRLAHEQKVNFSDEDQTRVTVGLRF
ncbi:hypothetical protein GH865_00380 [Rhodocyclus tenuis]|uniref:hypothetical protein n=1 Tax=Rhodocyclus gracilis TaxID=2929842 RepID=UPI001298B6F7|nr:hypothetical protein [Rhodocyclus gracilis]MRD71714.1 hypothetical protein [Rhodocyclus gracilis]